MSDQIEYGWVECSCGKEFHVRKPLDRLRIACPACEALMNIYQDMCPATFYTPRGASACMLPFRHKGQCQRDESHDDEIRQLIEERRAL